MMPSKYSLFPHLLRIKMNLLPFLILFVSCAAISSAQDLLPGGPPTYSTTTKTDWDVVRTKLTAKYIHDFAKMTKNDLLKVAILGYEATSGGNGQQNSYKPEQVEIKDGRLVLTSIYTPNSTTEVRK